MTIIRAEMPSLERRAFLRGMLTLSVAPALMKPQAGLTALEAALESLRHAHLMRLMDPKRGIMPTLVAVQGVRGLGMPRNEIALYCRLAFRMARRDMILIRRVEAPSSPLRASASYAGLLQERFGIVGDVDENMRALPWPRGWAGGDC